MSFYEDLAAALDAEGIESRVNDDTLFVPISSGVEIQFDVTNELPRRRTSTSPRLPTPVTVR